MISVTPLSLADAVQFLCAKGKPILIPDTCAFLDIIRVPVRVQQETRARNVVESASRILSAISLSPVAATVVIPPLVSAEWQKHTHETTDLVTRHFRRLDAMTNLAAATAGAVHITATGCEFSGVGIETKLYEISKGLLETGLCLAEDATVMLQAARRAAACTPPARKGAIQDCVIYEHSLELIRCLRGNSFNARCVFLTSNTQDFCGGNGSLPVEPIFSELHGFAVAFCTDWGWALHELGL